MQAGTAEDNPARVTEERERELLGLGASSDALSQSAEVYRKKLREESLEGLPDHVKWLYMAADYFGITTPDQRIAGRIKKSDESCIKQRVLISQQERKILSQEQLIQEKEAEFRDSAICFDKRKRQMEEAEMQIERLEEEKQEIEQKLSKNPVDNNLANALVEADSRIMQAKQDTRRYERERNEFASRIVEAEAFVKEAQDVLISTQVYHSALQRSYLKSRLERMRLAPVISIGKSPAETIDVLVNDNKVAEETGRLADVMTEWVSELTGQISELNISPRRNPGIYSDMKKRYESSSRGIISLAEKIIGEKRKAKYT